MATGSRQTMDPVPYLMDPVYRQTYAVPLQRLQLVMSSDRAVSASECMSSDRALSASECWYFVVPIYVFSFCTAKGIFKGRSI